MKVNAVTAEWSSTSSDRAGWVLCFSGGPFDGVPLTPAPEWAHAVQDLDEENIRDMIQATASWEGIPLATDFTVNLRR
jgi:hypothetical protein